MLGTQFRRLVLPLLGAVGWLAYRHGLRPGLSRSGGGGRSPAAVMLRRLWVWAHAVRCYLRLCGVWLCTTSHGLRSLQWTRRTRAHSLFLGLPEVLWWRTFGKSIASVPLPSTAPSRAHP